MADESQACATKTRYRYIFHIVGQKITKSGCNRQEEEKNETFNEMIAVRILLLVSLVSPAYMFMFSNNFAQTRTRLRTPLSMKLQTGIVGLPNVGKSTLFNALVGSETAQAANFPFCTIEPNVGIVNVPDKRLDVLGEIHNSVKVIPAAIEFVDIAGIVKGASEGAGLGNKFLMNIRMTDAIVHVVRCFVDDDIIHVDGNVDPLRDVEVISLELILADLSQIEKRLERARKDKRADPIELAALEKVNETLLLGKPARLAGLNAEELELIKSLMLLTLKPVIYAANVADSDLAKGNEMSKIVFDFAASEGNMCVLVSAQVESELAGLGQADRELFLADMGVSDEECGLQALTRAAYASLGLQTFFTAGPTETKAWTINRGMTAPQAAGVIHTDFEKGFIRAETISYEDMKKSGSEKAVKEAGLLRSEGRDYVMKEGDIVLFRFNV